MNRQELPAHSGERFKDIPEIFEGTPGQCLLARTDALLTPRELGPPDLAYIVKSAGQSSKTASKETCSYHHVLGVDTSSSASMAAYVNSLTYSLEQSVGWFRSNPWKITRSVYCSYNAFAGVDVRVEARIPGGVTAYAITPTGAKIPTTAEMWQETFLSAVLRAIHHTGHIAGLRQLDMLPTEIMERRFLEAAAKSFWTAWQLGAAGGQPIATNISNYLATGIYQYFKGCQRPQAALEFFQPLVKRDPEVISLVAQCMLDSYREPEAIKEMHRALTTVTPYVSSLLVLQCEFLLQKERYAEAVEIGKFAVKAAPVDYLAWTSLARALVRIEDYEAALSALNTCPVTLVAEAEPIRLPANAKPWIPHRDNAPVDNVSNVVSVDSILERLRAPALKGAVRGVYQVLAELVKATGWDELLKLRARVFVMEEEYRAQRVRPEMEEGGRAASPTREDEMMEDVPLDPPEKTAKAISKRLCERWLDNLFMILFEDMRVYTIYRGEMQHFQAENMAYQRTAREWLIIGHLCRRLLHMGEAKEAYRKCVEAGFCADAWLALLEIYTDEGKLSHALNAAAKLMSYDSGYHRNNLYPSPVGRQMYQLIRAHGAERIKTTMVSLNLGAEVDGLVQRYLDMAAAQKTLGHDI